VIEREREKNTRRQINILGSSLLEVKNNKSIDRMFSHIYFHWTGDVAISLFITFPLHTTENR
jgi:hypothetical protein